ncbi:MAG: ABC transporter ATP-binding protein [Actinomycetales bacterium]
MTTATAPQTPLHTPTASQADTDIVLAVTDLYRSYGRPPATLAHRLTVNPFASARDTRFAAVRGVSFEVRRGELFALLGSNGAGKTSTVEALEGLAPPTGGSVRVLGLDPYRQGSAVRSRTGIMLQEAGFPDGLTAAEYATAWAATLPHPRPVEEALDLVQLGHRARVQIASLSGGERRRLDLALALLGRPEVLFLDEPTTGLDPQSRHQVWQLVQDLLDEGTTILLTTHYLEEAERLADRIAIMSQGRIAVEGTVQELVSRQHSIITFDLDADTPLDIRNRIAAFAETDPNQKSFEIRTFQLQRTLAELIALAGESVTLGRLQARSATLEQAFLSVVTQPEDD